MIVTLFFYLQAASSDFGVIFQSLSGWFEAAHLESRPHLARRLASVVAPESSYKLLIVCKLAARCTDTAIRVQRQQGGDSSQSEFESVARAELSRLLSPIAANPLWDTMLEYFDLVAALGDGSQSFSAATALDTVRAASVIPGGAASMASSIDDVAPAASPRSPSSSGSGSSAASNGSVTRRDAGGGESQKPQYPSLSLFTSNFSVLVECYCLVLSSCVAHSDGILDEKRADSMKSVTGKSEIATSSKKSHLSSHLVARFHQFLEGQSSQLHRMLERDIRLLEAPNALSAVLLVPECRKKLPFAVKHRYFDLCVRRFRRQFVARDSEDDDVESPVEDVVVVPRLATFYADYQRRARQTDTLSEREARVDRDHTVYLDVDRDDLLESSYEAVGEVPRAEWLVGELEVSFVGEDGVDRGGLTREWLRCALVIKSTIRLRRDPHYIVVYRSMVTRAAFAPENGLFVRPYGGPGYQPRPLARNNSRQLYVAL